MVWSRVVGFGTGIVEWSQVLYWYGLVKSYGVTVWRREAVSSIATVTLCPVPISNVKAVFCDAEYCGGVVK